MIKKLKSLKKVIAFSYYIIIIIIIIFSSRFLGISITCK